MELLDDEDVLNLHAYSSRLLNTYIIITLQVFISIIKTVRHSDVDRD
jgi:transcriptional regulator of nitric oxide reductase